MKDTDKIKEKLDIVEFINSYVSLKKAGRNYKALCPFHSEKTPSFMVSPDRQIWYCFGGCNEGGDIFKFYMKAESVEFGEAFNDLAKQAGVTLTRSKASDDTWRKRERLYSINHFASEYYHYVLTKHNVGEKARKYLEKRNVSKKALRTFMLGYAPFGWRSLLTYLRKKGFHEQEIEQTGLIVKGEGRYYDRFRGRIIFTLFDHRDNIVGFSGRVIKSSKGAKYINTPETLLYHKSKLLYGLNITQKSIAGKNQAIITEGEFDVISGFQNGIANTVAIKGTALTENQLKVLKRFTDEVVLALDADFAGDAAARRSIELLEKLDFTIRVLKFPKGKDLDEAIQKDLPALKNALERTVSVYDFILDSAVSRIGKGDPFSKKKIAQEVMPIYARITNPIIKNSYAKKLAKTLGVSEDAINEQLERQKTDAPRVTFPKSILKTNNRKSRTSLLEEQLLSLVIQSEKPTVYLKKVTSKITIAHIHTNAVRRIFALLEKGAPIPAELLDTYNRAALIDLNVSSKDGKMYEKEFETTLLEVQKSVLRRKIRDIATKLKEEKNINQVSKAFSTLSKKLKQLEKNGA